MINNILTMNNVKFIKSVMFVVIALLLSSAAMAQSVDRVVVGLSERSMSGSHVRVTEDSDTREAVRVVEAQRRQTETSGFRIVIFSDNGQYAGDNAEEVLKDFRGRFPHINAYLVYESPYFKVSVGDCLSMEEAQILMAELTPHYPKAFPKRETIGYEELGNARRKAEIRPDSLTMAVDSAIVVSKM